jgi:ribosomal protein L11 methyltransferase
VAAAEVAVALAAGAAGIAVPAVAVEPLAAEDWVASGLRALPPVAIGRFRVAGSHVRTPAPHGRIALTIDAGLAFGSGHHATTAGCLLALGRPGPRPQRVLDVGCGAGVLAIAAARLWRRPVLAIDIDAEAVAQTRANARTNGVGPWITARTRDATAEPPGRGAAYPLIVANILMRPLIRMARGLAGILPPGGRIVLSGFVDADAARVLAAYRAFGLRLSEAIAREGWTTLVLIRPTGTPRLKAQRSVSPAAAKAAHRKCAGRCAQPPSCRAPSRGRRSRHGTTARPWSGRAGL